METKDMTHARRTGRILAALLRWIRSHHVIAWIDGDAIELVIFWNGSAVGDGYDVERVTTISEARDALGY